MTRPVKIAIAIASLWPLVWMAIFFVFIFGMMFSTTLGTRSDPANNGLPFPFGLLIVGHGLTILLSFALTAFYIVYLFRTDRVPQDKKALWAVVLFLGNMIAFPIFWYLYIWYEPEAQTGA